MSQSKTGYRTKQRQAILNFLRDSGNQHLSAEDIVVHLKAAGNPVGKATVYRYLDKLIDQGLVRKYLMAEGGAACFQYLEECTPSCHHLKCTDCGKLIHLECSYLNDLKGHLEKRHHFLMDDAMTLLYGRCEQCDNPD